MKYLDPKNDLTFKRIFAENKDLLISFLNADQYTFLLNKYDKELELEAKIISNIATASIKGEIKLFIPEISSIENEVYSKFFISMAFSYISFN
jgi:hypothetical protein